MVAIPIRIPYKVITALLTGSILITVSLISPFFSSISFLEISNKFEYSGIILPIHQIDQCE